MKNISKKTHGFSIKTNIKAGPREVSIQASEFNQLSNIGPGPKALSPRPDPLN